MVALPQLKLISLKPHKVQKNNNTMARALRKMSSKSPVITVIRKTTTLEITSSQKTSCSFDNFHPGNY